jgi:hypothetical protein
MGKSRIPIETFGAVHYVSEKYWKSMPKDWKHKIGKQYYVKVLTEKGTTLTPVTIYKERLRLKKVM